MDFSAILEMINIDAIMTKITDLLTQINFEEILAKVVEWVMGLIA